MAITATQPKRLSDLLKVTDNQLFGAGYMTKMVTVNQASDTDLVIGQVMGTITASGKYIASLTGAVDGSETISAVCLENVSVTAATDTTVEMLVRGGAIVGDKALVLNDQSLADATTALEAMNPPVLVATQL